jgi:hypothetical protein
MIPWTMHAMDDASLGQCLIKIMRPLEDVSLGGFVHWRITLLKINFLAVNVQITKHINTKGRKTKKHIKSPKSKLKKSLGSAYRGASTERRKTKKMHPIDDVFL